jgi:sugar (pentulose or hexulose) kinase
MHESESGGTVIGPLAKEVLEHTGLPKTMRVVAGCTHDTASAVAAAVPAEEGEEWAYLSSRGPGVLLGVEMSAPAA